MDKTTNWLIRIAALVVIGAGVTYLFGPEIGSLNPETRKWRKFGKEVEKVFEEQKQQKEEEKNNFKITCLNCVKPKYPPQALSEGIEGTPAVKVFINKDGTVSKAIIETSSGYKVLDDAALDAVKKSTFYPIPKESSIRFEYNMTIK